MRVLVGVACIAIIAAVGYYFWGEYAAFQKQEAMRRALNREAMIARASQMPCQDTVTKLIDALNGADLTGADQIPADLRETLKWCAIIPVGHATDYTSHQLQRLKIAQLLPMENW